MVADSDIERQVDSGTKEIANSDNKEIVDSDTWSKVSEKDKNSTVAASHGDY